MYITNNFTKEAGLITINPSWHLNLHEGKAGLPLSKQRSNKNLLSFFSVETTFAPSQSIATRALDTQLPARSLAEAQAAPGTGAQAGGSQRGRAQHLAVGCGLSGVVSANLADAQCSLLCAVTRFNPELIRLL